MRTRTGVLESAIAEFERTTTLAHFARMNGAEDPELLAQAVRQFDDARRDLLAAVKAPALRVTA